MIVWCALSIYGIYEEFLLGSCLQIHASKMGELVSMCSVPLYALVLFFIARSQIERTAHGQSLFHGAWKRNRETA